MPAFSMNDDDVALGFWWSCVHSCLIGLRLHFLDYIGDARSFSASYCAWFAGLLSPQQHGTLWVSMSRSLAPAAHQW